ncbi:Tfp pilus assembly protein PilW [Delftia tsuruhatensis]|uniref:prepilin-type N-terminal cleavage/methylation domain-containing protein n=1 Tax=Delftia tsuruhatensis TaxID=180282 RepID=UPI001E6DA11D|nr:prepilin-type N-terminal cleavage/methylation domain-containing protein [Delftia tsuruhatensis]CAB5695014.1 Tfp pilus assembly protein PilW [Delftia tsuruhatensis]CAC9687030.1 Tfp pilus assembly protein PilW [Delftia tsuruhatensis]
MPMAPQAGLTLVELMVALAIGLFIVLIATTIYMQGLSSLVFRVGQSENLGNSRQALAALDAEFSKAGYRRDPAQSLLDAFPADPVPYPNGCQFGQGQAFYAVDLQTICMRFQPRDTAETDCAGTPANLGGAGPYDAPSPAPAPAVGAGMFVEKYTIENSTLVCKAVQQAVPLVDGVRAVHFEFGVDQQTSPGAIRRVDAFLATLPEAKESVRSLRYAILLESSGKVTQGMSSTVCDRWAALGGDTARCDANAGQLLQLATGTLSLRNLMP